MAQTRAYGLVSLQGCRRALRAAGDDPHAGVCSSSVFIRFCCLGVGTTSTRTLSLPPSRCRPQRGTRVHRMCWRTHARDNRKEWKGNKRSQPSPTPSSGIRVSDTTSALACLCVCAHSPPHAREVERTRESGQGRTKEKRREGPTIHQRRAARKLAIRSTTCHKQPRKPRRTRRATPKRQRNKNAPVKVPAQLGVSATARSVGVGHALLLSDLCAGTPQRQTRSATCLPERKQGGE